MPLSKDYYQLPIDTYMAVQDFGSLPATEKHLALHFCTVAAKGKFYLPTATTYYYGSPSQLAVNHHWMLVVRQHAVKQWQNITPTHPLFSRHACLPYKYLRGTKQQHDTCTYLPVVYGMVKQVASSAVLRCHPALPQSSVASSVKHLIIYKLQRLHPCYILARRNPRKYVQRTSKHTSRCKLWSNYTSFTYNARQPECGVNQCPTATALGSLFVPSGWFCLQLFYYFTSSLRFISQLLAVIGSTV